MTQKTKAGTKQAREPNLTPNPYGVVPPVHSRFGQPGGNPINKKGVVRSVKQLRLLIQDIGEEKVKHNKKEVTRLEKLLYGMYGSKQSADKANILKGGFPGSLQETQDTLPAVAATTFSLPADMLAPDFVNVYRDIRKKLHTEYLFYGGRGSTKSSFVSLATVELLVNNPEVHGLATRQVANTLKDSVYSQLQWAINELGLAEKFKCTTSPLQMEYLPTHQLIYFRGADDPAKMKSIKPPFGYLALLWFEELDQFHGPEAVRKIEQSVIRGGDLAWIFKSFNPPRTSGNWANKYCMVPKESQLQHHANYLTVPPEWLGQVFLDEAEHLKQVNPLAYAHEYMGEVNGTGGQVFDNVKLRTITPEEIVQFDRVHMGVDWGFFPDPFAYVKMHYDAARLKLYIFDEYRAVKKGNKQVYTDLVKLKGVTPADLLIADSAEPKSIADFRDYGATCRGAEKGPDSINYSMKWLQSLAEIVIDNVRAPEAAQEFIDYELEVDKDGEYISEYPDKNDHFIAATRYGMNLVWRRRGQ